MTQDNKRRERVARRAYEIFEARGKADGLNEDDWLQAEREIAAAEAEGPQDAGPNVPIDSGGVGERSGDVFPDVDEPGEETQPLPPPGQSQ